MRSCQIHCQSNSKFKENHTSLSFADLEETAERNLEEEPQEQLVLFLEMAYTAHINDDMANNVESMLVAAAEAKALNLGVMLVVRAIIALPPPKVILKQQCISIFQIKSGASVSGQSFMASESVG